MFDVGFGELVLLFVIGLLVLGPQRLPKVAAELGKWVGRARRTASDLRRQLEREIELSEITRPPPPAPPPQAEPTSIPPDPYTPEAQHGHEPHSSANGGAAESAAAEPPAPTPAPAEPAPAEAPSQLQDPVHPPPQH